MLPTSCAHPRFHRCNPQIKSSCRDESPLPPETFRSFKCSFYFIKSAFSVQRPAAARRRRGREENLHSYLTYLRDRFYAAKELLRLVTLVLPLGEQRELVRCPIGPSGWHRRRVAFVRRNCFEHHARKKPGA